MQVFVERSGRKVPVGTITERKSKRFFNALTSEPVDIFAAKSLFKDEPIDFWDKSAAEFWLSAVGYVRA